MDDGPYWVTLLKYGSHDMRHTGFRRLTVVNRTPRVLGCHIILMNDDCKFSLNFKVIKFKKYGHKLLLILLLFYEC